jgi:hypothetical protein
MSPSHVPPERPPSQEKSDRRRFGRAQRGEIVDSYKHTAKPHEPTSCTQCGAVYDHGRWQWSPRPDAAQPSLCPACHRINDRFPAGIVTLTGKLVGAHKDEIVRLVRHQEQAEKSDHPLNRIMAIDDKVPDRLEISTTDIHLPRRIANAMRHAYKGEATEHFDEGGYFVRVNWHRDG